MTLHLDWSHDFVLCVNRSTTQEHRKVYRKVYRRGVFPNNSCMVSRARVTRSVHLSKNLCRVDKHVS